jgi:hypothetical protein
VDCFPLPENSYYRSSGYRTKDRPDHYGVDLAAPDETPLAACITGRITVPAFQAGGAGNNIWIDDGKVWWKYFHMSHISVVTGQKVEAGELVGAVGHTGGVVPPGPAGAHLHIERHTSGPSNPTDPTKELNACEKAAHFPTAHLPIAAMEADQMTDDDRQWILDQLNAQGMNNLKAIANMAHVVHHDLDNLCERLSVEKLPEFTVNFQE